MKIAIITWSFWRGQNKQKFELPNCKDGYPRKKTWKKFIQALKDLEGKKIKVEVKE